MNHFITVSIYPLLPLVYALVATCFWILALSQHEFSFILNTVMTTIPDKLLIAWSWLGLLFWLPFFRKNIFMSLLHSIPFFLLPLMSTVNNAFWHGVFERDDIFNLLRVYLAGLLIYAAAILLLLLGRFLLIQSNSSKHPTR